MSVVTPIFTKAPEQDLLAPLGAVSGHMAEQRQMLDALDTILFSQLIEIANEIGNPLLQNLGEQLISLLAIYRRDHDATKSRLDAVHSDLLEQRRLAHSSVGRHLEAKGWLAPHPRLAAAIRKWTAALAAFEGATEFVSEAMSEAPVDDGKLEAAADLQSNSLYALVNTPAPGIRALMVKMSIILREEVVGNDGFAEAILADLERLTNDTENEPWLVQSDKAEPCACEPASLAKTEA